MKNITESSFVSKSTVSAPNLIMGLCFSVFMLLSACATNQKVPVAEQRAEIRTMAQSTLSRLYAAQPLAKSAVEAAAGYAVFSNFGMKIFLAGGGSGRGIAVNNSTRQETFMRMVEVQAGLGIGVKKFQIVFVFENENSLNTFINTGWEFGGQTTAAAQLEGKGGSFAGALSVSPGVWMYQLTEEGLALELTAKGTKYFKDNALN